MAAPRQCAQGPTGRGRPRVEGGRRGGAVEGRMRGGVARAVVVAVGLGGRARGGSWRTSVEEQMACGLGVCLGCAVPARSRPFRYVCKDGPVFEASDILDVAPKAVPAPDRPECLK